MTDTLRQLVRRIAAGLVVSVVCGAAATAQERAPRLSAWVVDWNDAILASALGAIENSRRPLAELDLFRFRLSPDGNVIATRTLSPLHRQVLAAARRRQTRVIATLVNDVVDGAGGPTRLKDPGIVHDILVDSSRRDRVVQQIQNVLAAENFSGLDLDFEEVHAIDRAPFTAFVRELAARLHGDGRELIVTVQPQASPQTRDGPGAQDLVAIGAIADEVRVMAYHYHYEATAPGAAAPLPWLQSLIDYGKTLVPADKLAVALYVGGWQWRNGKGERIKTADARSLAKRLGANVQRSTDEGALWFRASGDDGPTEVWFDDACSLAGKVRLAARNHLRTVALWHLGAAPPHLLDVMQGGKCKSAT